MGWKRRGMGDALKKKPATASSTSLVCAQTRVHAGHDAVSLRQLFSFSGTSAAMSLFSLFSSKAVNEFGATLAQDIIKRYPVSLDQPGAKKLSAVRLTRIIEDVCKKAEQFQRDNKLGLIRKAKLGNTFRWELKEKGYSDAFIEVATESLMVYLTKGSKPATSTDSKKT